MGEALELEPSLARERLETFDVRAEEDEGVTAAGRESLEHGDGRGALGEDHGVERAAYEGARDATVVPLWYDGKRAERLVLREGPHDQWRGGPPGRVMKVPYWRL